MQKKVTTYALYDWARLLFFYSDCYCSKAFKGNPHFENMDKPHAELHVLAKEAAVAYQRKDITVAEEALTKMGICSKQVVEALNKLKMH